MEVNTLRLTIGEMRDALTEMIRQGELDPTSRILWATNVEKDSSYDTDDHVPVGSMLFGLEWKDHKDKSIKMGTLKLEPPLLKSMVC